MVRILWLTIKRHFWNALLGRSRILMTDIFHYFLDPILAASTNNFHEFEQITKAFWASLITYIIR